MADINIRGLLDDLRGELSTSLSPEDREQFDGLFHKAAFNVLAKHIEGGSASRQAAIPFPAQKAGSKSKVPAGSAAAAERGRKAAETRKRNADAKASAANGSGKQDAGSGGSGGDPELMNRIEDASSTAQ